MNYMEEDKAVRNFIIVFVIVLILVVGLYFFTTFLNKNNEPAKTEETNTATETNIDQSKMIVGTILQKSEKDYYVILFKSDDDKAYEYQTMVSKYRSNKDPLVVYTVDLSEGINSKYYDKSNINLSANNVADLRFGDITLLEVKENKIVKSFDSLEKIKKEWKLS